MAFVTDDFDAYIYVVGCTHFRELTPRALDGLIRKQSRLFCSARTHIEADHAGPPTVGPGHRGFVLRRHAAALSARHSDAVGVDLLERYPGEIADHIGQVIRSRITDLVKELLTDRADCHTATRALWFGHHDRTVCSNLGNGVSHFMEGIGHLMPVGIVATGGLRPAFDQVAGK